MLHMKVRQCLNFHSSAFTVLVIYLTLIHSCKGRSQVIGPSQPIVATVGNDTIFPCRLEPAMDAFDMTVEWARPDLDPRFVLVWRDGGELQSKKHPSYEGRTSVFGELKHGDLSLKLSKVKLSDEGTYRCFVPQLNMYSTVKLVVGSVSSPVVNMTKNSSVVVLQCESKGWYPQPEVFWLDGEGKLLSAGPTETVRGPDDLYTVSSRVTVEKRHSNNFTCRVQQNNTNQIRETHIHVPDDFFLVQDQSGSGSSSSSSSSSSVPTIIGVIIGFIFIVAVVFVVWKWRQNKLKNKKHHEDEETQRVKEKSNSTSNNPEQETLIERETERQTMKIVNNKINPSSEETRLQCEIKEETHQRETNNVLVQRQEETVQQSVNEGTNSPVLVKRKPDDLVKEGETKTGLDKTEEENKPTSEEAEAPGPADDKMKQQKERHQQKLPIQSAAGEEQKRAPVLREGKGVTDLVTEGNGENDLNKGAGEGTSDMVNTDPQHEMEEKGDKQPTYNLEKKEGEKKIKSTGDKTELQILQKEEKHGEQLKTGKEKELDKERERLQKQQQTKERQEKKFEEKISRYMKNINDENNKRKPLSAELEEVEMKLQSVNSEKERKMNPETQITAEEEEYKNDLEKKKAELQKDLQKTENSLQRNKNELTNATERKMKATNEKENIIEKLKEIEKQRTS